MRNYWLPRLRRAAVVATACTLLTASLAAAQLGDPGGPGQAVPQPPAQCTHTIACTYTERNTLGPDGGYRYQMLNVCGANCTTQYWISDMATGKLLLAIDPVRGGGIVAFERPSNDREAHPRVRVVVPDYGPTDPACCPTSYRDTTYSWDAATSNLVAGQPRLIPTQSVAGWDAMREQLRGEGFFNAFPES